MDQENKPKLRLIKGGLFDMGNSRFSSSSEVVEYFMKKYSKSQENVLSCFSSAFGNSMWYSEYFSLLDQGYSHDYISSILEEIFVTNYGWKTDIVHLKLVA